MICLQLFSRLLVLSEFESEINQEVLEGGRQFTSTEDLIVPLKQGKILYVRDAAQFEVSESYETSDGIALIYVFAWMFALWFIRVEQT